MSVMELKDAVTMQSIVVAGKEQISCDVGGESVILDIGSGIYYSLDATGSYIWSLIQERKKVGDVRDAVLEEFGVDPEMCELDLVEFLNHLASKRLLEIENADS
jgi:Coenzyme PQQ synthesis protein D (PqqD)